MTPEAAATVQAWAAVAQAVGALIALAVAVGVPIWQQRQARRAHVAVEPVLTWPEASGVLSISASPRLTQVIDKYGAPGLGIRVINKSHFDVIIDDIGLTEGPSNTGGRSSLSNIITHPGRAALPHNLAPNRSVLFLLGPGYGTYSFSKHTRAYASTAANGDFYGSTSAFRAMNARRRLEPMSRVSE